MKWKIVVTQNDYFAFTCNDVAILSWDSTGVLRNNQGVLTNVQTGAPSIGSNATPMVLQDWTLGTTDNGYLAIIRNQAVMGLICPNGQLFSVINNVYYALSSSQTIAAPSDLSVPKATAVSGSQWSIGPNASATGFVMQNNGQAVFFFGNSGPISANTAAGWVTYQNANTDPGNPGSGTMSFYEYLADTGGGIFYAPILASVGIANLISSAASSVIPGIVSVITNPPWSWNPSKW